MCGRYASVSSHNDLIALFKVDASQSDPELPPDYNMAPTKTSPVILARPPRDDRDADPIRQLRNLVWGLVPSWAKDRSIGSRMINARAETVTEKPSFRKAFATRRCIIPADGFYEWLPTNRTGRTGKPVKQPYFIHHADGTLLAFAGIYEFWKDPTATGDDAWLSTFAIITTTATDTVGRIHDRMPMAINNTWWSDWLDPATPATQALTLMAPPDDLDIYTVSTAVNNVHNNGPALIQPAEQ